MKNLIIAAHPDDEILGCGGLIAKQKKCGIDSYVVILTDGAKGRYSPRQAAALRKNALEANKKVGTKKVFFEDFPNQKLDAIALSGIIGCIEKYISRLDADSLYTHHAADLNKDHRIAYEASITAARPIPGQKIKRLFTYNVASATEWNSMEKEDLFIPNIFLDIAGEIGVKTAAMSRYESEARPYPHPRSPEAIKAYANYWGISAGIKYAEPFRLIREVRK
ncbi:MAG: PIG-L deacetylase family protein [Candidatus Omnitrophota bacterium]|jgi:LmbE family N-acetylglucosaminyl deacetylase